MGLTYAPDSGRNYQVTRWRISEWNVGPARLFLLGVLVVLMLLVVALPDDVDLPDAAFLRGTAPALVHAQATSAPSPVALALSLPLPRPNETLNHLYRQWDAELYPVPNFRPIFLRTIRR